VCGSLNTFVIAKWLYGSNPQEQEAIKVLTTCHFSVYEFFFGLKESKGKEKKIRRTKRRI